MKGASSIFYLHVAPMSKGMPLIHKPPIESNVHPMTNQAKVDSFQPKTLVSTSISLLSVPATYH